MQDIFKRLINEIFLLKFKPYGWKKQGSNFRYIDASGLGRVINFQKSKWNTADELEFFINYGLYIEIDNQLVNKSFKEYECQFRARTGLDKGHNIKLIMKRNVIEQAFYVGDTEGDEEASRFAGIPFIYASYGFGKAKNPDMIIHSIKELPKVLLEMK